MAVCDDCQAGRHEHDRYTGQAPGTRAGDDAGCPRVADGMECACRVVLTPVGRGATGHCPTCRCV